MKDTFTSENAGDFRQRYVGSYGYYMNEKKGVRIPVYFDSVEDDTLYFKDLFGTEFNTHANSGAVFEFMQMTRRIYPGVDGNVYCIQRSPARQWRRGVCSDNTYAVRLDERGALPATVGNALMKNILLYDGNALKPNNVILSDQFAIVGMAVFLYYIRIGEYDKDTKVITLYKEGSSFKTELDDVCKNLKITVKNQQSKG